MTALLSTDSTVVEGTMLIVMAHQALFCIKQALHRYLQSESQLHLLCITKLPFCRTISPLFNHFVFPLQFNAAF